MAFEIQRQEEGEKSIIVICAAKADFQQFRTFYHKSNTWLYFFWIFFFFHRR